MPSDQLTENDDHLYEQDPDLSANFDVIGSVANSPELRELPGLSFPNSTIVKSHLGSVQIPVMISSVWLL